MKSILFALAFMALGAQAADTKMDRKVANKVEKNSPFQLFCHPNVSGLQEIIQDMYARPIRKLVSVSSPAQIGDQVCVTIQTKETK